MKIVIMLTDSELKAMDGTVERIASSINTKAVKVSDKILVKEEKATRFRAGSVVRKIGGVIEVRFKESFVRKVLELYTDLIATAIGFATMFKPRIQSLAEDFEPDDPNEDKE